VAIQAGREVLRRLETYLSLGISFGVETTLAGHTALRLMERARAKGFSVHLMYVCVAPVEIALGRIAQRVAAGGHGVPEADVRRRYGRSLSNLPVAIAQADHAILFDNTSDEGPRLVLALDHGDITIRASDPPSWVTAFAP
jgi:predicted ABC-type ATPase